MVNIEKINPGTPIAGPYSPGIKVGDFLFISGQGAAPNIEAIEDQTISALENIKKIVETAGTKVSKIVKTTVFLEDINDFKKMNEAYKKWFEQNGVSEKFPARSTVEVAKLPLNKMLVEIEAIVAL